MWLARICQTYLLYCFCISFEDDAEEKCHTNILKAIEAEPSNPDAVQLMASFLLTKEKTQVSRLIKNEDRLAKSRNLIFQSALQGRLS